MQVNNNKRLLEGYYQCIFILVAEIIYDQTLFLKLQEKNEFYNFLLQNSGVT